MKTTLSLILLTLLVASSSALGAGVVPETSVLLVDEATGEGSMVVQNTDNSPLLLYTNIENIKEDQEDFVIVTPPMARLEAGQSQLVRFLLNRKTPLATQRLKRVTFEGIPFSQNGKNQIRTIFRQNIPMIVLPRSLDKVKDPWTQLTATLAAGGLRLCNDSPYIVRLAQRARLDSPRQDINLPKAYILPGEHFDLAVTRHEPAPTSSLTIWPATVYGYAVDSYKIKLTDSCRPGATKS